MPRLLLLLATSAAARHCSVRLLYSNETQAASVAEAAPAANSSAFGAPYYEFVHARCLVRPNNVSLRCVNVRKPPYLTPSGPHDRVLLVFRTAACAALESSDGDYVQVGDAEYMPMGILCKPAIDGLDCFDDTLDRRRLGASLRGARA